MDLQRLGQVHQNCSAAAIVRLTCILALMCMVERMVEAQATIRLRLEVTTPLKYTNTPLDPQVDFADWVRRAGKKGFVDLNSVEVFNRMTNDKVAHVLDEGFAYSDRASIGFIVANPAHRSFEVRFKVASIRTLYVPSATTPVLGVGDLLRYNSGKPGGVNLFESMDLKDVNGDGRPDFVGTWNYFHKPGSPTGGVVFYPAIRKDRVFEFGELRRLRYMDAQNKPTHFANHYNAAAFADFNRDGRLDLVYTTNYRKSAQFFLATKDTDPSGAYRFKPSGAVPVKTGHHPIQVIDMNRDGALDLVVNGELIENHRQGWPFKAVRRVNLSASKSSFYADLNGDGHLDAVGLKQLPRNSCLGSVVTWRPGKVSADDPLFEGERRLAGVETADCTMVKVVNVAARTYLLVQSRFQDVFAFERISKKPLKFQLTGRLESPSAVLNLSDQAWPCFCDWDSDGDMDLLVGHGYGWPRILINRGTRKKPVYAEAKEILADGKPIRLLRNEILGEPGNWHNMGYSYPDFVDWDGDGLKDLMLPNETNRLYWYRNVGSAQVPRFAKRRQIICDGYPDNAKMRAESQRRANDPKSNNGVYPLEKERPFFWRTGVAFADFNADGLMDLITLDGFKRQATLFSRYRTAAGQLRLRRDSILKLKDGRPIDDRIVARGAHWGESFRAIDWDKDGRIDLLYSVAGSHHGTKDGTSIYLLRNVGTKARPVFEKPQSMKCFGEPIKITNHGPHPWPTDFDGDGTPDIVACVEWSVYPYYCHAALMMKERPKYTLELLQ